MPKKNTISQDKYDRDHCVRVTVKLNTKTDAPILALFERMPFSMSGLIRRLLMDYIIDNYPDLLKIKYYEKPSRKMSLGKSIPTKKE